MAIENVAERLQEEVDRYNALIEQRDTLSQQFQATVTEIQTAFGRIQVLNELTEEPTEVDEPESTNPDGMPVGDSVEPPQDDAVKDEPSPE